MDSFGDTITLHQYGLARKGRILEMQQFKLNYAISTLPGHSGSPIFVKDNIIGIHNGAGAKDNMFNIGRLMTF